MKNCLVRSYNKGYLKTTEFMNEKLNDGWIVKSSTPFVSQGTTEYIEYILEKDNKE